MPALITKRLRLVPITLPMIEAVLRHDRGAAEAALDEQLRAHGGPTGATFPDSWPNDDLVSRAFPFSLEAIRADPERRLWGDSMALRVDEPRVVGSVVFRGRPDDGVAEVGYGIEDTSRGLGLATEATRACVDWAIVQPGVTAVRAVTFPFHHASLGVIRKLGMQPCGTREHAMLGDLIVFERRR
ncbi:MAG TPA: GNAT family N-acetyltransferase [Kofleriaceae bacterium]|jgi:RimJ/RimL family protein N-acetyltransferase|nr:GNAT family N-acetyltransferase [Kofleriaceae bacterium]